jgi:sugar/nucleoside kinase (ribokinase family)
MAGVQIQFINDAEIRQFTGKRNLVEAAEVVRGLGPHTVVVKRGEHGATLYTGRSTFWAPAYPIDEVVDPTGAGDTFAGGFMGYLARSGIGAHALTPAVIKRAMIYGSALASFCVEDVSLDRLRTTTLEDVARRFRAFYELTQFEHLDL